MAASLSNRSILADRYRYREKNPDTLVTEVIQKYLDMYKTDGPKKFWNKLMKHGDKYTVRSYLAHRY